MISEYTVFSSTDASGNTATLSHRHARLPLPSCLKRQLVSLGIYGLTHDHSWLWVAAISTIIRERRWSHE
jgi:hypothetical protein